MTKRGNMTRLDQLTECFAKLALDTYRSGYDAGYRAALHDYAWWKDGQQYVGSGTRTLAQALEKAEQQ